MLNRTTLQSTLALTALLALAACADSGNAGGEGQDCYPNSALPVGGVEYNAGTCTGNPSDQTCTSTFGKAYSAKCCCF